MTLMEILDSYRGRFFFTYSGPLLVLCLVQLLFLCCSAADSTVNPKPLAPAFVILGDSTVDVGVNNYLATVIKCNWEPYGRDFVYGNLTGKATGRFCNGKLISDFLAEKLGLPYPLPHGDPSAKGTNILQGINTASSGTGWYDGTAALYNVASLTQQLEWVREWQHDLLDVIGIQAAAAVVQDAVYIVSTGSNDWVNNYYNNLDLQSRYSKAEFRAVLLDNVTRNIQALNRIGAQRIAIVSLPPLGCLPSQITARGKGDRRCVQWMQDDAKTFNDEMNGVISKLKTSLSGTTIVVLDAFSLIFDAFSNPSKYGLSETDRGCCGTGLYETGIFCTALKHTCDDASQYLFWDSYHPTEFFNRQAADVFWDVLKQEFKFGTSSTLQAEDRLKGIRDELR
ncbi:hypothetical protein AXG93_402s1390 [Marchantia polymorpha subsp. ruderalis]|uniref:SGNH hydrolase-type esterase domain-containing protein n=1 Tax=Marchantia polymorpha subsp. ruderalis TaxID=1480154 RepID=A0A176WF12_MARPO|nr:hypothetical protein AXG93_402s1390 [Marchantia polymorpha subsp. ruderalis]